MTRFKWAIKSPSSFDFSSITNDVYLEGELSVVGGWATGSTENGGYVDLRLPSSYFSEPGCYELRLQAKNPQVCTGISTKIIDINIEDAISPEFEILDSSNNNIPEENDLYEICSSSTVNFSDITEYEDCDGSTFAWSITSVGADNTPNTGDENTSAIEGIDYESVAHHLFLHKLNKKMGMFPLQIQ